MMQEKCILFCRISSIGQQEGFSLEAQERIGNEYALRKNFHLIKTWKVTESAWTDAVRKQFNEMLEYVCKSGIKHILLYNADRLSRNVQDFANIEQLIKKYDLNIHFTSSNRIINKKSSPFEKFAWLMETGMSVTYSDNISERVKLSFVEKLKKGQFYSKAPIGYKNNQITHQIELDVKMSDVVKTIFNLYSTGKYSVRTLHSELKILGIRSARGNVISAKNLYNILNNPLYCGYVIYNEVRYDLNHIKIISEEEFNTVNRLFKRRHYRRLKHSFSFSHLVRCGTCKGLLVGSKAKNRYTYYVCSKHIKHDGVKYYSEQELERIMLKVIEENEIKIKDYDEIVKTYFGIAKTEENPKADQKEESEKQLKILEDKLQKLLDAYLERIIDKNMYVTKKAQLETELASLRGNSSDASNFNPNWEQDSKEFFELCVSMKTTYLNGNSQKKAELLRKISSNFYVNGEDVDYQREGAFQFGINDPSCVNWLGSRDSNPDSMIQSHESCRWTTPQFF